jgi:hypothetical protein
MTNQAQAPAYSEKRGYEFLMNLIKELEKERKGT